MSGDQNLETIFRKAVASLAQAREQVRRLEYSKREPIAILGSGLRLPGGANDLDGLWEVLASGRDTRRPILEERFDAEAIFDPDPEARGRSYTRHASLLDDVASFDAAFFGISPREALSMDPQHRLLLEVAWTALESAQLDPRSLKHSKTGVFVGIGPNEYNNLRRHGVEQADAYDITGSVMSFAAGRLAYHLGLQGPVLGVDTACSSSLVALHLACKALRNGECDVALAGAVQVLADPTSFILLSRAHVLAPDGRCKTFSDLADGYGRGEGVAVLALARLETARARGLKILGLVRGSAVNSDGASSGITAPNGTAQQQVICAALADAGLAPAEIDFVECHGTGTRLGDPIEVNALAAVYGEGRPAERPLRLGATKANIGHLESAAGLAGVLKILAAIRHEALPPTPHTEPRNTHIDWEPLPVRVVDELTPWPREPKRSRRAGVSAFGLSGTNAHVILEEAPGAEEAPAAGVHVVGDPRSPATGAAATPAALPIVVSGLTREALAENARRLAEQLETGGAPRMLDLSYSLTTTRTAFPVRLALTVPSAHSASELAGALRGLAQATHAPREAQLTPDGHRAGKLALLFSGQGTQRLGMGKALAASDAHFARLLDETLSACDTHLARPLKTVLWADLGSPDGRLLDDTRWTQPALFALEVALARRWLALGARPNLLLGHSVGELAAAHVAGVLSLDDAARLVCARGELMARLATTGGAMASLSASEAEVREALAPCSGPDRARIDLAALNAPDQTVVSGDADTVARLVAGFAEGGRKATRLVVSHAFHSPHMDGMLQAFRAAASSIAFSSPRIPVVSNVTGRIAEPDKGDLVTADYWVRHVRGTVRFSEGVSAAAALGVTTFLECGPHGVLCALVSSNLGDSASKSAYVPSLRKDRDEALAFVEALCALHVRGHEIDWIAAFDGLGARRIDLPTYAFQRQHYWFDAPGREAATPGASLVSVERSSLAPTREVLEGLDALPYQDRYDRVLDLVRREVSVELGLKDLVARDQEIQSLGLDSLMSVQIRNRLAARLGRPLPATLLFDHGCADDIAGFVARDILGAATATAPSGSNGASTPLAVDPRVMPAVKACETPAAPAVAVATRAPDHNPWLPGGARSGAELRLFCLPFAGGGTSAFRTWRSQLPVSIDVCPIALPGREARLHEPALRALDRLVSALADAIEPALDLPFVLFGQSVGALVAFELARELRRRAAPAPRNLLLAAYPGPERRKALPFPSALSDDEFIRTVNDLWQAIPAEIVAEPELLARLLPALRADFDLQTMSEHVEEAPLAVPISAWYGTRDPLIGPELVAAWGTQTSSGFTLQSVEGGHLFHADPSFIGRVEARLRVDARSAVGGRPLSIIHRELAIPSSD
jgi:acyl transferase domain-containing protein